MFAVCLRNYENQEVYTSSASITHTIEGITRPNTLGRLARRLGFKTAPIKVHRVGKDLPESTRYVILKDGLDIKDGYIEKINRSDVLGTINVEYEDNHHFTIYGKSGIRYSNNIEGITEDIINEVL